VFDEASAMKSTIRTLIATSLAAIVLILSDAGSRLGADPPRAGASGRELVPLGERYGLRVVVEPEFPVNTVHGEIRGRFADLENLATYIPILASEWNIYPPELVEKSGLRRLVLCEDLEFAGQRRTALPDFEHHDLYLDVGRGRYSESYVRKVIHHEFFHVIDFRDDGALYADEDWAALNSAHFRYGGGGRNAQDDPGVSVISDERSGFLNRYCMTGVEEDKAELFAQMLVGRPALQRRAARDPVLRAKVERMQELVRAFCPQADQAFWDAATEVRRPQD
jgi:hypothetical protein